MRETTDLSQFLIENETYKTKAYEHALDLAYMFAIAMEDQGFSKTELAEKMGISLPRLSKLFNTQPNMTLETIARFELALDIDIQFEMHRRYQGAEYVETVVRDISLSELPFNVQMTSLHQSNTKQKSCSDSTLVRAKEEKAFERRLAA